MDEINLSTLRTPKLKTTVVGPNTRRDLSGVRDIVLDNTKIDQLIAKSPNILSSNTGLARKKAFLDDLQQQYKIQEALIDATPRQIAQQRTGRQVSKVGLRAIAQEAQGPLERDLLTLGTVIEQVKGNVSTAQALARAAGSSSIASDKELADAFKAEATTNAEVIESSGQDLDAMNAALTGQQARLQESSQTETDRVLVLADIASKTSDPELFQRLINAPLEVVLDEAERLALRQQEQNIARTATDAERIAQRINSNLV